MEEHQIEKKYKSESSTCALLCVRNGGRARPLDQPPNKLPANLPKRATLEPKHSTGGEISTLTSQPLRHPNNQKLEQRKSERHQRGNSRMVSFSRQSAKQAHTPRTKNRTAKNRTAVASRQDTIVSQISRPGGAGVARATPPPARLSLFPFRSPACTFANCFFLPQPMAYFVRSRLGRGFDGDVTAVVLQLGVPRHRRLLQLRVRLLKAVVHQHLAAWAGVTHLHGQLKATLPRYVTAPPSSTASTTIIACGRQPAAQPPPSKNKKHKQHSKNGPREQRSARVTDGSRRQARGGRRGF